MRTRRSLFSLLLAPLLAPLSRLWRGKGDYQRGKDLADHMGWDFLDWSKPPPMSTGKHWHGIEYVPQIQVVAWDKYDKNGNLVSHESETSWTREVDDASQDRGTETRRVRGDGT